MSSITRIEKRFQRFCPNNEPRWVRIYDDGSSLDRYTVVFTGRNPSKMNGGEYPYLAMSNNPFHPQGFCQHGSNKYQPCDVSGNSWAGPSIGRKNHLGRRIAWRDLPRDCQIAAMVDYADYWKLYKSNIGIGLQQCGLAKWEIEKYFPEVLNPE